MYCISCKKNNVIPVDTKYQKGETEKVLEEDILWKNSKRSDGSLVNINNEMIDNGIIHIIDAGYGSTHDGDQILIAICDNCIKSNLEDATLLYYGDYMGRRQDWIEDERGKSKQKYRRRKNLDGLI